MPYLSGTVVGIMFAMPLVQQISDVHSWEVIHHWLSLIYSSTDADNTFSG